MKLQVCASNLHLRFANQPLDKLRFFSIPIIRGSDIRGIISRRDPAELHYRLASVVLYVNKRTNVQHRQPGSVRVGAVQGASVQQGLDKRQYAVVGSYEKLQASRTYIVMCLHSRCCFSSNQENRCLVVITRTRA
jgi:hypothetical protein